DLRGKLTHFPPLENDTHRQNPFVLKGKLTSIEKDDSLPQLLLTFENREGKTVRLAAENQQLPENISDKTGSQFCFGPVEETAGKEKNELLLKLQNNGKIQELETENFNFP
ncbi:MAG: hypothetical protein ACLFN5_04300, partial [bacterium]